MSTEVTPHGAAFCHDPQPAKAIMAELDLKQKDKGRQ